MSKMILWHGSPMIIEHPDLGKGKEHNDYGRGSTAPKAWKWQRSGLVQCPDKTAMQIAINWTIRI